MANLVESSVLQLLTDPGIRAQAAGYFEDWMFSTDMHRGYLLAIKDPRYIGKIPDPKAFVLHLHHDYAVSPKECAAAVELLSEAGDPGEEGAVMTGLETFLRDKILSKGIEALSQSGNTKSKIEGYGQIKTAVDFQIAHDDFHDFSDPNVVARVREEDYPVGGKIIKSSFSLINENTTYGGFKSGDLIMFAASPKVGKSTALVQEGACTIEQGFRVAHIFLGDLSDFDAWMKYASHWSNTKSEEILANWQDHFQEHKHYMAELRVRAWSANSLNVFELLGKAEQLYRKFPFNMLIVDYDANITNLSESMYEGNGIIYACLKGSGKGRWVTMTASQLKIQAWDNELVGMGDAAESSKKQHHIDMMIGLGKNPEVPYLGTMNLAAMRRGTSKEMRRIHFDYPTNHLREISTDRYDFLLESYKLAKNKSKGLSVDFEKVMGGFDEVTT